MYKIKPFPHIVKVLSGRYKDFIGEVWMRYPDKYECVTRSGWYFTVNKDNIEVLQEKRQKTYV